MPGQLFYALNLPDPKADTKQKEGAPIRAIISVLEGRGTKLRITTELQYLMDSKWNWDVERISESEFLATLPSRIALNLLAKMGKIKFVTADIMAVVEESNMEPGAFQVLQSVWVRAVGIPRIARSEFAVLELARLVGDPEEVHNPSLNWKSVWVKVSCKNPDKIGGTSEVFINKQGRKISWYYSEKLKQQPPTQPDDDWGPEDDQVTDEEDPESQESHGWLETGFTHQGNPKPNEAGPSVSQGKKNSGGNYDKEVEADSVAFQSPMGGAQSVPDLVPEPTNSPNTLQQQEPVQKLSDLILDPTKSSTLLKQLDPTHDCEKLMSF